jgi:hypothetical protein
VLANCCSQQKMTIKSRILLLLIVFSFSSCSSPTEQIENKIPNYVGQAFPNAEHKVERKGNDFKLTISTADNISKTELDRIMVTTLEEF